MANIYVVSTPIGNLKDITLRAVDAFASVKTIICEDTRVTKNLMSALGIDYKEKHFLSYHSHNKISQTDKIIELIRSGADVILVSDAGTPGISDPGSELISIIRKECEDEISNGKIKISTIPGPSALTAALSISGVDTSQFVFLGFMPHKKGRETLFGEIATSDRTIVFYESPHRIEKTLNSLVEHLGDVQNDKDNDSVHVPKVSKDTDYKKHATNHLFKKRVTVCRELTKMFEEVVSGSPEYVRDYFAHNQDKVRGEFVVIVSIDRR